MSAQPQFTPEPRFRAIPFLEYMKIEVPPTSFIVDGLLVEGSAVLMSAREKAGKGLIALDLASSVALGVPFLGRSVKEGPVIYVALEENIGTIKNRLHQRVKPLADIPLYIMQLDGSMDDQGEFYIDSIEGVDGLAEQIVLIQPVLIIIDTLREAHRGRENESDDMAPRLRAIRTLAHKTNTTIIVTHHAAKMTGGARGSTAIRAAFDDTLEFTRKDSESDSQIRGVLHAGGRNLQKAIEHIAFNPETFQWDAVSAPTITVTPNLRQRILESLDTFDDWMLPQDLVEAITGTTLGSVQNTLGRMMQEKPRPFAVDNEKPRKGHPRKYHTIQLRDIPHHSSLTNDVMNEEKVIRFNGGAAVGRKCVDCGKPTGADMLPYCPDHSVARSTGTDAFVPLVVEEL